MKNRQLSRLVDWIVLTGLGISFAVMTFLLLLSRLLEKRMERKPYLVGL